MSLLKYINRLILMVLFILALAYSNSIYSQTKDIKAKQNPHSDLTFKALFINNFIKYINWPENAVVDTFRIGILNDKALKKVLIKSTSKITYGESAKPIKVIYLESLDNIAEINMIYSDKNQNGYTADKLFNVIQSKPILLITENFEENNTMINLFAVNTQQKFDINKENLTSHGLSFHSMMSRYVKQ